MHCQAMRSNRCVQVESQGLQMQVQDTQADLGRGAFVQGLCVGPHCPAGLVHALARSQPH
jgi:hypothetical protein